MSLMILTNQTTKKEKEKEKIGKMNNDFKI